MLHYLFFIRLYGEVSISTKPNIIENPCFTLSAKVVILHKLIHYTGYTTIIYCKWIGSLYLLQLSDINEVLQVAYNKHIWVHLLAPYMDSDICIIHLYMTSSACIFWWYSHCTFYSLISYTFCLLFTFYRSNTLGVMSADKIICVTYLKNSWKKDFIKSKQMNWIKDKIFCEWKCCIYLFLNKWVNFIFL